MSASSGCLWLFVHLVLSASSAEHYHGSVREVVAVVGWGLINAAFHLLGATSF
jgi:hypothetical protein